MFAAERRWSYVAFQIGRVQVGRELTLVPGARTLASKLTSRSRIVEWLFMVQVAHGTRSEAMGGAKHVGVTARGQKSVLELHMMGVGHGYRRQVGWSEPCIGKRLSSFSLDKCVILGLMGFGLGVLLTSVGLLVLLLLAFGVFLRLGDLGLVGVAISALRLMTEEGLFESRVTHAGGMTVCDPLSEDGILRNLIPVDLLSGQRWECSRAHLASPAKYLHPSGSFVAGWRIETETWHCRYSRP